MIIYFTFIILILLVIICFYTVRTLIKLSVSVNEITEKTLQIKSNIYKYSNTAKSILKKFHIKKKSKRNIVKIILKTLIPIVLILIEKKHPKAIRYYDFTKDTVALVSALK